MSKRRSDDRTFNVMVEQARRGVSRSSHIEAALHSMATEPVLLQRGLTGRKIAALFRGHTGLHIWETDCFHHVLQRLEPAAVASFWKSDLKPGLLTEGGVERSQWSKCYAYIVNEWRSPFAEPLLEA